MTVGQWMAGGRCREDKRKKGKRERMEGERGRRRRNDDEIPFQIKDEGKIPFWSPSSIFLCNSKRCNPEYHISHVHIREREREREGNKHKGR